MADSDLYWMGIDLANGILSGAMLGGYYALISVGPSCPWFRWHPSGL